MDIYPAIDLLDGCAVRLAQGRRESATVYSREPWEVARGFAAAGAARVHLVDLDAAFSGGAQSNAAVIARIAEALGAAGVALEVGGGLRTLEQCQQLLGSGVVGHAVLGTAAIKDPEMVERACARFPGRIVVAVDAREGKVAVEGWTEATDADAVEIGRRVAAAGAGAVLYTDIGRDGMRGGPNLQATARLVRAIAPCAVIGSGGVACLEDLDALRAAGAAAAVVGKALYEKAFTVEEAVARARGAA